MELRKAIGNRKIEMPPHPPFHRGAEYLSHYACFDCRKSFKQNPIESDHPHVCPDCAEKLSDMGRDFRPPRKAAKDSWEVARRLYDAGFRFFGSGSHSCPELPTKLNEVDEFIRAHPFHSLRRSKWA
jgi:DNA-directed RNA polymerase subunit RPC12/RpoP